MPNMIRRNYFTVFSAILPVTLAAPVSGANLSSTPGKTHPADAAMVAAQTSPQPALPNYTKTIKDLNQNRGYEGAMQRQNSAQPVGAERVQLTPPVPAPMTPPVVPKQDAPALKIERPPLTALISIGRNLNPFGLDANTQQPVTLRDALLVASGANLDILHSFTSTQSRRWFFLQSLTDYLPSLSFGLNEIGLRSTSSLPIQSTAQTPEAAGAGGPTTVTALATKTVINTPLTVLNSGFTWKPVQGGQILFTALANKHRLKASRAQLKADISDTLLKTADDYYDLIYNEALLHIRAAAVTTSEEQVRQNQALEDGGLATNLDVLQSKTQLSKDRQNLVDQQRVRRAAAIKVVHDLNISLGQDLLPTDTLQKVRLISSDFTVNDLLTLALDNRPELKRYEELRLAAKREIMASASGVLPSLSLGGNIIGLQSRIGRMYPTYLLNFGLSWKLDGLGTKTLAGVQVARWQARQAMLEANQQFLDVMEQVRNSYNESLTTEGAIDEANSEVDSSTEELRLARMRLDHGLGTNIDVLTAQRDLTQARIDQALALMNFNRAQAKLLRNIGLVSIDSLSAKQVMAPKTR